MKSTNNTTPKRGRPAGQSRSEFQCVSFLTTSGLRACLRALVEDGTIGHFWFVKHDPDEETRKPHHHLRMTPPVSRSVDWAAVCARVVETVPGEDLPRRLVASSRAANNESLDGLLYARHDTRYCTVKGLRKRHYDYPRTAFETDDADWLDALWAQSDDYTPTRRRLGSEELLAEVERNPRMSRLDLLRLCLLNGATKGTRDMLEEYARELIATKRPNITTRGNDNEPPDLDDWPSVDFDEPDLPGLDESDLPSWS